MGENKDSMAIEILKTGNQSFVENIASDRVLQTQVKKTSLGQTPFAAVLSCIDSRVPVETVFGLGVGDIFSFRAAGNFVDKKPIENNNILGSLEFATDSGVQLILVLGHTGCGAIKAAIGEPNPKWPLSLGIMVKRLRSNITKSSKVITDSDKAIKENVVNTIKYISKHSAFIKEKEKENKIEIRGGVYNIATGEVKFI
ncbi:MAG: carbonic anhydrase [Flavobacteriaceae bacterium]